MLDGSTESKYNAVMPIRSFQKVPEHRPVPIPHAVAVPPKQDNRWKYGLIAAIIILLLLLLLLLAFRANSGPEGTGLSGAGLAESGHGEQGEQGKQTGDSPGELERPDDDATNRGSTDERPPIAESESVPESGAAGTAESQEVVAETEESRELAIEELLRRLAAEPDETETDVQPGREQKGGDTLVKGDATVNFFGATGKGSKFVFVFDRSGSMRGNPLEAVKRELIQALDPLKSNHSFNIISYDDQCEPWQTKLVSATPATKADAIKFIENTTARGGTFPRESLLLAIDQKPQVIFFMTDGEFSLDVNEICQRAKGVVINTVQFSDGAPLAVLQELAKRTGGDFMLLKVRGLSDAL